MNSDYLLQDDPLSDENDLSESLNILTDKIIEIIQKPKLSFPILVSGDWGSGKTSLLKIMEKKLASKSEQTIWFESWHYEKEAGLLPALIRKVWESTPECYKTKEDSKKLWHQIMKYAVMTASKKIPEFAKMLDLPFAGLLETIMKLPVPDKSADDTPDPSEPPLDAVMKLRQDLSVLIKEAWGEKKDEKDKNKKDEEEYPRLIIFIDDLDRCTPDGSVALLDAIRMLVTNSDDIRCRFVVALDRSIVTQAITTKFEGISGYDGNRYLEKIFPIEFHVPTPSVEESAAMIQKFLGQVRNKRLDRDSQDALTTALAEPAFANPRLMKRTINRFQLLCDFESQRQKPEKNKPEKDRTLARWIAGTERWPGLRRIMQQQADRYWRDMAQAVEEHNDSLMPGPEAKKLFLEPGALAWMRKENIFDSGILASFREAEKRLHSFGL